MSYGPKRLPLAADQGRFERAVPRYKWRLRVRHPSFRSHSQEVQIERSRQIEVRLRPVKRRRGRGR